MGVLQLLGILAQERLQLGSLGSVWAWASLGKQELLGSQWFLLKPGTEELSSACTAPEVFGSAHGEERNGGVYVVCTCTMLEIILIKENDCVRHHLNQPQLHSSHLVLALCPRMR